VLSSSVAWSDVISHAKLFYFFTDQPRNPWQMLVEPFSSAEPRLKVAEIDLQNFCLCNYAPTIKQESLCLHKHT